MSAILTVKSPYDHHFIREFPLAGEREIERAISKAYDLFHDQSRWLHKYHRIEILERLAGLMEKQVEELTRIAAEEGGKPYRDSKVEVLRAINGVKIATAELYNLRGEEIPMGMTAASVNRLAFTTREPIGVVFAISAFNHPLNLIIHQVIPAIATGCPVIVKPASSTPVSCFNLVRLLYEAGLPEAHCTALVCRRDLAEKLSADPRIGYVTFIGSHAVGWHLRSILAPGTRIALEHGGVAPVIIDKSAEIEEIAPGIAKGGFYHAGQVCVSVQRVFVHEEIARPFAEKLAEIAANLKVGDPLDPQTDIGPMIAESEVNRVHDWVEEAKATGAELLTGGQLILNQSPPLPRFPASYSPTVLFAPPEHIKVSREEVFGPVICVYPYSDLGDAISKANNLRYAFQAAVFTRDIDMALETAQKLNASAVMINDHTAFRVDWMPFGGRDESGIGIGGIPYSMHEMTREKLIVMKSKGLI
ncbi:MAG: aldehyde dehydrogenase family protein [Bacteroidales bacterium]|nr:aldehyde dehydrogenase family protein [Bacteroidales bacterium]